MGNPLLDRRTPSELAEIGQVIEVKEKLGKLERLAGVIGQDLDALEPATLAAGWRDAPVEGQLRFGYVDAQGRVPALEGHVEVTVDAVCQRCLEPFKLPLTAQLRYVFEADRTAIGGDEAFETWELDEATLRPVDLVDEALVMAMPLAAMHVDDARCREPLTGDTETEEKIRPFAALKAQMSEDN